jgi:hypothetical protein
VSERAVGDPAASDPAGSDSRAWIALLALACATAGVAGGVLFARSTAPREPVRTSGAYADYERLLSQRFELSGDRRAALEVILASYEDDVERIKDRHMAEYMSSMEPELVERGRYYHALIRERVLPESARPQFDQLALGRPANP